MPRWRTNTACSHQNDEVCATCDFDRYYANKYPGDCPWAKTEEEATLMLSENLAREASNKVVERFNVTFSAIDRRQRDALLAISQVWDSRYFEEPWPTVSVAESAPDCTGAGSATRAGEGNHAL